MLRNVRQVFHGFLAMGFASAILMLTMWPAFAGRLSVPPPLQSAAGAANDFPNCRFGVGVARNLLTTYNYTSTRSGWYVDWGASSTPPAGMDYYRTIRAKQSKDGEIYLPAYEIQPRLDETGLGPIVRANRGQVWLIGNEPDRPYSQDDMMPDMYAQVYHDAYRYIKNLDPTAKIAIGAVVEPTPLRLQYLDKVLKAYSTKFGDAMPIDVWNVHLYMIPENHPGIGAEIPPGIVITAGMQYTPIDHLRIDVFTGLVVSLRTWMRDRGYQNIPLIITEYGALYPLWLLNNYGLTQTDIDNFIRQATTYMLNQTDAAIGYPADGYRLVQQAAIYSLDDDSLFPSDPPDPTYFRWGSFLFRSTAPYTRTASGNAFVTTVQATSPSIDLNLYGYSLSPGTLVISPAATISPTFRVLVSNAGNVAMDSSAVMTFTDITSGGHSVVGTASLAALPGCGASAQASVRWPNLSPGLHVMRVEVTAGSGAGEALKSNNVLTATISVGTHGIYLPLVRRL